MDGKCNIKASLCYMSNIQILKENYDYTCICQCAHLCVCLTHSHLKAKVYQKECKYELPKVIIIHLIIWSSNAKWVNKYLLKLYQILLAMTNEPFVKYVNPNSIKLLCKKRRFPRQPLHYMSLKFTSKLIFHASTNTLLFWHQLKLKPRDSNYSYFVSFSNIISIRRAIKEAKHICSPTLQKHASSFQHIFYWEGCSLQRNWMEMFRLDTKPNIIELAMIFLLAVHQNLW